MLFTIINVCIAAFSLGCTMINIRYIKKQTQLMEDQLEEMRKPDFPLYGKLDHLARSVYSVSHAIIESDQQQTNRQ